MEREAAVYDYDAINNSIESKDKSSLSRRDFKNDPMTFSEFRAWLRGYTEDMEGSPSGKQWDRILEEFNRIIFPEKKSPENLPIYPWPLNPVPSIIIPTTTTGGTGNPIINPTVTW